MKKILLILVCFFSTLPIFANNITGGEIRYTFIGTPAKPYLYKVELSLYRRNQPGFAPLDSVQLMQLSSGCFPTQNFTVKRISPPANLAAGDGGFKLQNGYNCMDTSGGGIDIISIHRYEDTITIPGKCANYSFSFSGCCRDTNIANFNTPGNDSIYLRATLNNARRQNSSALITNEPLVNVCVGTDVWNFFSVVDTDPTDSIVVTLTFPRYSADSILSYNSGYTKFQPIKTAYGFQLNHFVPTHVEKNILTVKVDEYTYDSTFHTFYFIGTSTREYLINITDSCDTSSPGRLFKADANNMDTASSVPCPGNIIKLKLNQNVLIDSIRPDGGDFRVVRGISVLNPVVKAIPQITNFNNPQFTNEIWLETYLPFTYNDTLVVYTKRTFYTDCGKTIGNEGAYLVVTGCGTSFNLNEETESSFEIFPNPVTDKLQIKLEHSKKSQILEVRLYNMIGSLIYQELEANPEDELQLDFSNIPSGVYNLQLKIKCARRANDSSG